MSTEVGFAEISEIYRNERRSKTITKIPIDFYDKADKYLADLEKSYSELGSSPSSAQAMMLQDEIKKVKKRMSQIYDHRERKISLAALSGACGGESPKYLTAAEKALYTGLVDVLTHFRQCPGSANELPVKKTKLAVEEPKVVAKPKTIEKIVDEEKAPEIRDTRLLRVLEDVPSFVGADRVYNLKKADIVTLPATFADVLVSRGAAKVLEG